MTSSPNYKNKKTPVSHVYPSRHTHAADNREGRGRRRSASPPLVVVVTVVVVATATAVVVAAVAPPLGILGVVASFAERQETPMRRRRCRERGGRTTKSVVEGGQGIEKIKITAPPHSRRTKTKTTTRRRKRTTPRGGYDTTGDVGGNTRPPPPPRNRNDDDENDG